jgi:hypothetical protein
MALPMTAALDEKQHRPRDTAWSMSQENVEIVRAASQAWNAGGMDAFREIAERQPGHER